MIARVKEQGYLLSCIPDVPPGFSLTCMCAQTRTRTQTRDFFHIFFRDFLRCRTRIRHVFFPESFLESLSEIPSGFQDGFRRLTDGGYELPKRFPKDLIEEIGDIYDGTLRFCHPEKSRRDISVGSDGGFRCMSACERACEPVRTRVERIRKVPTGFFERIRHPFHEILHRSS